MFLNFSNDVTTLKINALLDKYFGAGTYAKLEALPEILDWKVGDTMTLLAAKGITVEKITAIADTATQLLTGDDTATLKGVTGLDLNEIIDSYKDVTLGELLAKLTADEEVDYEAKAADLLNTLRSFYYNLSQVADPYGAETDGSNFEATYNEKWAQFKTTYPDTDWEHYVALVQEAYKTKAGDTAYAQYFGADCTKKLLVKGMMTALDDTEVFFRRNRRDRQRTEPELRQDGRRNRRGRKSGACGKSERHEKYSSVDSYRGKDVHAARTD